MGPQRLSKTPLDARRKRALTIGFSYVAKRRRLLEDDNDWISILPNDVLQKILSKVSTKEAVKTNVLSKRWVGLWRWRPDLVFEMNHVDGNLSRKHVQKVSVLWAESITKAMNNHQGNLESSTLHHYPYQSEDGTLEKWIQTSTSVKQTKDLTIHNHLCCLRPNNGYSILHVAPKTFSYHTLTTLSLCQLWIRETHHGFENCSNLKTLKFVNIIIAEVSVINGILKACSSLENLLLIIKHIEQRGVLKIVNHNLKYLQVSTPANVDGIEVKASSLDVLDMRNVSCGRDSFILEALNVLFNRDYWLAGGSSHISCNISNLAQSGYKRIWHELMVTSTYEVRQPESLSVTIDMTNPKEIQILKELLLIWSTRAMLELEILFKNIEPTREELASYLNGTMTLFPDSEFLVRRREDAIPFPNADFRVRTIWLYNFDGSNKKELTLASNFVRHKIVTTKMMIQSSSLPVRKKGEARIAAVRLMVDNGRNKGLSIQCF